MQLRKLVLACGFASFALSNYASALGLGEVKLNSKLDQPLNAELKLLDTRDLSAEQILISLASPADFERNGVERLYFYTEFQFEVQLDHAGGAIVKITSRNPVREPYLNFLIEARWSAGRLLREYTLLMDLPTFDAATPQATQAAATQASPVKPKPETAKPKARTPEVSAPAESASASTEEKPDIIAEQDKPAKKTSSASGTYGPVEGKDTLWEIAKSVRPDSSVSIHQTMMALQRLNPDAFINGNINLLKKGQVLRVPDSTEASTVTKAEALDQFNAQVGGRSGASLSTTALGAQLDGTRRTAEDRHSIEPVSGRVKLEAPSAAGKGASGQGSGANKGSGKALETELASTLEELDRAKSDKTELSSRVHDLEEQIKTMQRLVDVSNEKLRAMQLSAAKQAEKQPVDKAAPDVKETLKPESVSSAAVKSEAAVVTVSSQAASDAQVSTESSVSAQSSAAPAAVASKAVAPKKVDIAPPPNKSAVDVAIENVHWLGLCALGLAGAGFFFVRRRKVNTETSEYNLNEPDSYDSAPDFSAFSEPPAELEREERVLEEEVPAFDEPDVSLEAETGDVVSEADIYIAYGKYDQAEEMLLNGLAKDPDSTEIRLKLLEVYSQTQDLNNFDKQYAVIKSGLTAFAVTRVLEMRAGIPGAAESAQDIDSSIGAESVSQGEVNEFRLDDFDMPEASTQLSQAEDDNFNFDLELDDALISESDIAQSGSNGDVELNNLDKPVSSITNLDDDFTLDLDIDAPPVMSTEADDVSDISSALDTLNDRRTLLSESDPVEDEEEFNFNFDDIDDGAGQLAQEVESIKTPELLNAGDESSVDDFNLDMDVSTLDLAALDNEMAALDEEMASLDVDFATLDEETLDDAAQEFQENETLGDVELNIEDDLAFEFDETTDEQEKLEELSAEVLADDIEDDDLVNFDISEFAIDQNEEDLNALDMDAELAELDAGEFSVDEALEDQQDTDIDLAELDASVENDDFNLDDAPEDNLVEADLPESEFVQDASTNTETVDFVQEADLPVDDISDDDVFAQALSDFSADGLSMDASSDFTDDDMDAELDFMADADEAATKLDLARAYIDMGDAEGARDILAEVAHEGNDEQRQEAVDLLSRIDV